MSNKSDLIDSNSNSKDDFILVSKYKIRPTSTTKTFEQLIRVSYIKYVETYEENLYRLHFNRTMDDYEECWYIKESPSEIQELIKSKVNYKIL